MKKLLLTALVMSIIGWIIGIALINSGINVTIQESSYERQSIYR